MSEYTIAVDCAGETASTTFTPGSLGTIAVAVDTTADPTVTVTVTAPATLASASVDFGDTTSAVPVTLTAGTGSVQHTFATNGTFNVTATAAGYTPGSAPAVIAGV